MGIFYIIIGGVQKSPLVGAALLTSIIANVAALHYLQRCDQKVPPHPHQKSLKGKC